MSKDTSAPAFPVEVHNRSDDVVEGFRGEEIQPMEKVVYQGLSTREYAAIKILQGLVSRDGAPDVDYEVSLSVRIADALLAELAKSE